MTQAYLPNELENQNLENLLEGETIYTVPWAMFADEQGALWLNGSYTILEHERHGTVQMKVTKRKGQYIVDISHCLDHGWSKGGTSYWGDFTKIPVAKLIK